MGRLTKQNNKQGPRPKSEEEGSGAGSCGGVPARAGRAARFGPVRGRRALRCVRSRARLVPREVSANPAFFECWRAGCVGARVRWRRRAGGAICLARRGVAPAVRLWPRTGPASPPHAGVGRPRACVRACVVLACVRACGARGGLVTPAPDRVRLPVGLCPSAGRRKLNFQSRGGKGGVRLPVYDDGSAASAGKKKRKNKEVTVIAQEEEHTVPWIAALTTYFSYAILMVFGTLRDMVLNLNLTSVGKKPTSERKGYGTLLNDFQDFYTRRLYNRIQDCFNRPISSAPGAWIQVMERDFTADEHEMQLLGSDVTALNLASYNYLGFAESDLEMRDDVIASMRRLGVSNASARSGSVLPAVPPAAWGVTPWHTVGSAGAGCASAWRTRGREGREFERERGVRI